MNGMNKSGKLFTDELTEWLLDSGLIQSQYQMSIHYKYSPDWTKIYDLSCVDDCVYWYTSEALGKCFVGALGKIFHVNFLGYAHCFMSIRIYQIKDHSISFDQAIYAISIVDKYLDTATVKTSKNIYITNFPSDMIFTKSNTYTSDEQVEKWLGNSIFTIELVFDHWFIYYLQEWTWVFQCKS